MFFTTPKTVNQIVASLQDTVIALHVAAERNKETSKALEEEITDKLEQQKMADEEVSRATRIAAKLEELLK